MLAIAHISQKRIICISIIDSLDMRISLRQLEIFAGIALAENVSKAADRLAMSQSAASSALLELEKAFDNPLFDRVGKRLLLNSTGRGLLPAVHALLSQAKDIEAYLGGGAPGPLNIGATLTIGNYLAPLLLAEYMRRYVDARAQLHVANTDAIVEHVLHFESDLGLIEGDVNHPDLFVEPWIKDELVIFCAPRHALAAAGSADNETLLRHEWILRERGSGTRSQFDRIVAVALGHLNIRLELEHTEAIKRAVESGLGIGCLSRLSLREAFRRGSLIEIKTPQFDLHRRFYFVRCRHRHVSSAARSFLALCGEVTQGAPTTDDLSLPFIP